MAEKCGTIGNAFRAWRFDEVRDTKRLLASTQQFENTKYSLEDGSGYLVCSVRDFGFDLAEVRVNGQVRKLTANQAALPLLLSLSFNMKPRTQFLKGPLPPMFVKGVSDSPENEVAKIRKAYQEERNSKALKSLGPKASEEAKKAKLEKANWDDGGGVTYFGVSETYWKHYLPSQGKQLLTTTIARNVVNDRKIMFGPKVFYLRLDLTEDQWQQITRTYSAAHQYGYSSKIAQARRSIYNMLLNNKCVELLSEEPKFAELPASPAYVYECLFHDRVKQGITGLRNIHTIEDEHLRTTAFNILFLGPSMIDKLVNGLCLKNGFDIFKLLKETCSDANTYKSHLVGLVERIKPKGYQGTVYNIIHNYLVDMFERENANLMSFAGFNNLTLADKRVSWKGYATRLTKLVTLNYPIMDSTGQKMLQQLNELEKLPLLRDSFGPSSWLYEV